MTQVSSLKIARTMALMLAIFVIVVAPSAWAEQPQASTNMDEPARATQSSSLDEEQWRRQVREATQRQLDSSQKAIHIYQIVEEMIDELVADLSRLNLSAIQPIAIRNVGLTPNLSAHFGDFVESTVVSAVTRHTPIQMKRCIECQSLRSRIDGEEWVISMGLTRHEDLAREAERLGVLTYMDTRLSFFPGANIVAMQIEIFRASDGAILWTETYRSDATTAAILRTGDRIMTRAERVEELERRLDARPYYGHILYGGATYIPYDSPLGGISGAALGYRLYEKFGPDRRYLFGVGAEAFANFSLTSGLLGSFISATFQWELFEPNLNSPVYRTGPTVGGFFAGTEGNSYFFEWGLDITLQFRLGAGASLFYFVPTEYMGYDLGGFGAKARVSFNW